MLYSSLTNNDYIMNILKLNYAFLICFIGLLTIINSQTSDLSWNEIDYQKYNLEKFQKINLINEPISTDFIDYDLFAACIFYATNIQRDKYKKPLFKYSKSLAFAAQKHSENMVKYDFYSHTSTVKGERSMTDRLSLVGIENAYMAENIFNFSLINPTYWSMAIGLVDGWMKSKGHRANILDKNQVYLGCGIKYYLNEQWPEYFYVKSTQNFSSKKGD